MASPPAMQSTQCLGGQGFLMKILEKTRLQAGRDQVIMSGSPTWTGLKYAESIRQFKLDIALGVFIQLPKYWIEN